MTTATISISPLPIVPKNILQIYVNLRLCKFERQTFIDPENIHRAELDHDHALRLVYISPSLESRPWLVNHTRQRKQSPSALMKSRSTHCCEPEMEMGSALHSVSRTTQNRKQDSSSRIVYDWYHGSSWQHLLPRARVAPSPVARCRHHGTSRAS